MTTDVRAGIAGAHAAGSGGAWRCLHCRAPLHPAAAALVCRECGKSYPVLAGIPLLVREPASYLRAECRALLRAAAEARQRRAMLDRAEPHAGLPAAALHRHVDVLEAEAAQAETLLGLLGSALPEDEAGELQAVRPGWSFDTLMPYLVRDWVGTSELAFARASIGAALERALPDRRGKSVAFFGCGAAGLLAGVPPDLTRVVGFDLTLPILAAARRLLDGETLELPLPRVLNPAGRVRLRRPDPVLPQPRPELVAMDALDTAFAPGAIDCVVTVFLTDILPDPSALADEVHRVLPEDGIWINYGPSGNNLKALWRLDATEGAAFFEAAGFNVLHADAQRVTNLDISAACPPVSFRNAMCYLTVARKGPPRRASRSPHIPFPEELGAAVPSHFPGARLVHRLDLAGDGGMLLQHDRTPGREASWELGGRVARLIALVDGKRTVGEIALLLERKQPPVQTAETHRVFARLFDQGVLGWRAPGR